MMRRAGHRCDRPYPRFALTPMESRPVAFAQTHPITCGRSMSRAVGVRSRRSFAAVQKTRYASGSTRGLTPPRPSRPWDARLPPRCSVSSFRRAAPSSRSRSFASFFACFAPVSLAALLAIIHPGRPHAATSFLCQRGFRPRRDTRCARHHRALAAEVIASGMVWSKAQSPYGATDRRAGTTPPSPPLGQWGERPAIETAQETQHGGVMKSHRGSRRSKLPRMSLRVGIRSCGLSDRSDD